MNFNYYFENEEWMKENLSQEEVEDAVVEHVCSNFDFNIVNQYMIDADWKWWRYYGEGAVPTILQLTDTAKHLLRDVLCTSTSQGGDDCFVATGGFEARKKMKNGTGYVGLSFVHEYFYGDDNWEQVHENENEEKDFFVIENYTVRVPHLYE